MGGNCTLSPVWFSGQLHLPAFCNSSQTASKKSAGGQTRVLCLNFYYLCHFVTPPSSTEQFPQKKVSAHADEGKIDCKTALQVETAAKLGQNCSLTFLMERTNLWITYLCAAATEFSALLLAIEFFVSDLSYFIFILKEPFVIFAIIVKMFEKIFTEIHSQTPRFFCSLGSDTTIPPPRRVYTVSPAPEGYVAAVGDTDNITVSENSEGSADSTGKFVRLLL